MCRFMQPSAVTRGPLHAIGFEPGPDETGMMNEQLVELINRTVHAAALSALFETATGYRVYLGVYVRNVSRFTPFYMALDPFRKLIVYPSLLHSVRAHWNQAFGTR
jgi:hypothetical protein